MKQVKVEGKVLGYVSVARKSGNPWPVTVYSPSRKKLTSVRTLRAAACLLSDIHLRDINVRLKRKTLNAMKRGKKRAAV